MKRFISNFVLLLFITGLLSACIQNHMGNTDQTLAPTIIPVLTTSSRLSTPQPSETPKPSIYTKPSATQSPETPTISSPTPTEFPTKNIFIQLVEKGGDGGYLEDFYMGRGTPNLIIYTDGQLLLSGSGVNDRWYEESFLTTEQLCQLRLQIQKTGFFEIEIPSDAEDNPEKNPIYVLDDTARIGKGASTIVIQVNGETSQLISIDSTLVGYLIPEVKLTSQILGTFRPPGPLNLYDPERVLLWIEKGPGELGTNKKTSIWPASLPRLSKLWEERIQTAGVLGANVVVLQGDIKEQIVDLFQHEMQYKVFVQDDQEYNLILRPLLPHETVDGISPWPIRQDTILPFTCKN